MGMNEIELQNKKYVWHPFTQMKSWVNNEQTVIAEAKGNKIIDTEGKEYFDGVSSLWVNIHGHRKAEIDQAIIEQLGKVAHSTMIGLANIPATQLAEKLVEITPSGLNKVFYSDDGSTAVEVAIKIAFQYWQHCGLSKKNRFVSLNQAYHGDTIGTVSVGGIDLFHRVFKPLLFEPIQIPSPSCYHCTLSVGSDTCGMACVEALEKVLQENNEEIAAVILEPMVQATAGILVSPPGYLSKVRELTKKYNVLLIVDEVATGWGRTGKMFACEHENVNPDIMILSKGITGGYLPLAVTLTTNEIYDQFLGELHEKKTFYHGHSYTGNQLACAAALANLKIFRDENVIDGLAIKVKSIEDKLLDIQQMKHVGDTRQCGMIAGIELVKDKDNKIPYSWEQTMGGAVCMKARQYGLFIRPVGDVVVFMPPLSSSIEDIVCMLEILKKSVEEVTSDDNVMSNISGAAYF
ncbi:adenosylmethionine--8-amino-7-oxononanoate transaminase [Pelosinus baikalensis]|uniref:Adenosylmethionine-8-amino-7-oxononanoate aminotransferase n=1 Tax=Pelosinus baikalensis TaxID=2892015 RepID=A0ABS8HKM6_9FIRM|nr:adenosylmethionine--8-amino-7-oxononanoate transaminase [Pelosinus baikalensis]MCC5463746.1 adenosylmethionine--8-amino-7-oxononanoate transaminase [Pelosinus baikalensis]